MSVPTATLAQLGLLTPAQLRGQRPFRRLMIGTDGPSDSGKSNFANTAPGPIANLCLDRGHEGMLLNQNSSASQRNDVYFQVIAVPMASQLGSAADYQQYWMKYFAAYLNILKEPTIRTVVIDGDSDSWELQRLAEFGRLTKVPSIMYDNVNAARRAMIARAFDSGKIVIATNKVKKTYGPVLDSSGNVKIKPDGTDVREWDGGYERQGFGDQDFLWQIQLRHLYNPTKQEWGIRLTKCKPQPGLVGMELWGEDCSFTGLVQTVFQDVDLKEWGF